ncbi:copper-sensitivity suppressor membrane protein B [Salmonella enterica subsp. enterica]|nr:copper-sensitivity suppressor membrane protein B [Salmonella enterica subsp. enterica]
MIVRGTPPATLRGVLTLSTCSNVCLLTDYPFSVTPTVQNADFAHDYARAMGKVPLRSGLTDSLDVGYRPGRTGGHCYASGGLVIAPGSILTP